MAWPNWDQIEIDSVESDALFDLPTSDTQFMDFSSQWLFKLNFTAPMWPLNYDKTIPPTTSIALVSPAVVDDSWEPFGASFDDMIDRDQWDASGGLANDRMVGFDTHRSSSSSVPSQFQQMTLFPDSTRTPTQSFDSGHVFVENFLKDTCRSIGKAERTHFEENNLSTGVTYGRESENSALWKLGAVMDSEFSQSEGMAGEVPIAAFGASRFGRAMPKDESLLEKVLTYPAPPLKNESLRKPKKRKHAPSKSISVESSHLHQLQSHKVTEKNYRSRFNDYFTSLLKALPEKRVAEGVGNDLGEVMSKIDTFQLAMTRIKALEQEEEQLKEEGLVLRGQVGLFEKLFIGPLEYKEYNKL